MFVGIVVFGAEVTKDKRGGYDVGGSFGLAIAGMCATAAAGVTSFLQMRQSGALPCK